MNELQTTHTLEEAGVVANHFASLGTFERYRAEQSINTLKSHDQALSAFVIYLNECNILFGDPMEVGSWSGLTWGIVDGYKQWMLQKGLSIATINQRLSTVKVYAGLAAQAGRIAGDDLRLIQTVKGIGSKGAKRIDAERPQTRCSNKKRQPVRFTTEQVEKLIQGQPDTPQGRRDALIAALLFRQGLRAGEIVGLTVECFDIPARRFTFYREKVGIEQTHDLHEDTLAALAAYMNAGDCPDTGLLLRGSRKSGKLEGQGMTAINVTKRVGALAKVVGVEGASAHDARHWWATDAANRDVGELRLQEAGGWSSLAMPRRYVERSKIANKGMV